MYDDGSFDEIEHNVFIIMYSDESDILLFFIFNYPESMFH